MAKKKFSDGLEALFQVGDAAEETTGTSRKSGHKNFMSDLDFLLQEALEESLEKYESDQSARPSNTGKTKSVKADAFFGSGLDALIRQTVDIQEISADENSGKKRLTIAVDRDKIETLKRIAKLKNAYLKDLLVALIDEYIDTHGKRE